MTLNDAISMAVRCDNRLFEQHQEHQLESPSTLPRYIPTPTAPPNLGTGGDAMQLDAVHPRSLSASEKERCRANNLCLYCGGSGHFVQSCPLKRSTANQISSLSLSGNAAVQPQ